MFSGWVTSAPHRAIHSFPDFNSGFNNKLALDAILILTFHENLDSNLSISKLRNQSSHHEQNCVV